MKNLKYLEIPCYKCGTIGRAGPTIVYCNPCYNTYMIEYRARRADPSYKKRKSLARLSPEQKKLSIKKRNKRYYELNAEHLRASSLAWFQANREHVNIMQKKRYHANKTERNKQQRTYYWKHREKILVQHRKYRKHSKLQAVPEISTTDQHKEVL